MHRRHVTLQDVAMKAGVSRQTISRYVNESGCVSAKTRERIRRAIDTLHYHPSAVARSLRRQETLTIGLALYSAEYIGMGQSQLFAQKLAGMLEVLAPRGYGLEIVETNPVAGELKKGTFFRDKVREGRLDGLIVSDFFVPSEDILALRHYGVPFVVMERLLPQAAGRCVIADEYLRGYRLTQALVEAGHEQFAYCGWPPDMGQSDRFRAGMDEALREGGKAARVVAEVYPDGMGTPAMLERLGRTFMGRPTPTAAVCTDDWLTDMVAVLARRGVPAARDFGFAGVSLAPAFHDPEQAVLLVTPVDREMGIRSGEILLDLLAGCPDPMEESCVGGGEFIRPGYAPALSRAEREHYES